MGVFLLVAAATLLGLVVETTLYDLVPFDLLRPDLMLILCVYLGLHSHSVAGSTGAFLLGYATDAFAGYTVGLHAFAMSLVFTLVYLLSRRLWMDNALANVAVVFVAAGLKVLTVALLLAFYLDVDYPWSAFLAHLSTETLAAAAFAFPVFALLDRGRRRFALD